MSHSYNAPSSFNQPQAGQSVAPNFSHSTNASTTNGNTPLAQSRTAIEHNQSSTSANISMSSLLEQNSLGSSPSISSLLDILDNKTSSQNSYNPDQYQSSSSSSSSSNQQQYQNQMQTDEDHYSGSTALGTGAGTSSSISDSTTNNSDAPKKNRRRRKPINCSFCRRRKLKCDRKQPCSNCIRRNIQASCVYAAESSLSSSSSSHPYNNATDSPLSSSSSSHPRTNQTSFPSSFSSFIQSPGFSMPLSSSLLDSNMTPGPSTVASTTDAESSFTPDITGPDRSSTKDIHLPIISQPQTSLPTSNSNPASISSSIPLYNRPSIGTGTLPRNPLSSSPTSSSSPATNYLHQLLSSDNPTRIGDQSSNTNSVAPISNIHLNTILDTNETNNRTNINQSGSGSSSSNSSVSVTTDLNINPALRTIGTTSASDSNTYSPLAPFRDSPISASTSASNHSSSSSPSISLSNPPTGTPAHGATPGSVGSTNASYSPLTHGPAMYRSNSNSSGSSSSGHSGYFGGGGGGSHNGSNSNNNNNNSGIGSRLGGRSTLGSSNYRMQNRYFPHSSSPPISTPSPAMTSASAHPGTTTHLKNGTRASSSSSISVNSLSALFSSAPPPPNGNASSSSSSSSANTNTNVEEHAGELQSRLETMERLLLTLVNQSNNKPNSRSNSNSKSNSVTGASSVNSSSPLGTCGSSKECASPGSPMTKDNHSNHSSHANSISSNKPSPSDSSCMVGMNGDKPQASNHPSVGSSTSEVSSKSDDDNIMINLRESLGMLKLDMSGKSVYHGDTHWGSLITEIDEVAQILGKLKAQSIRISEAHDSEPTFPNPMRSRPGAEGGNANNGDEPQTATGSRENPADISTGGCFVNNSYFASLQSSDNYMKVLDTIPNRQQCDMLLERYFSSFNCIFPIVNMTTFFEEYKAFWADPPTSEISWVALFLAMLCLGLQSYGPNSMYIRPSKKSGASPFSGLTEAETNSVFIEPFRDTPELYWNIWLEGAEYCANSWKLNFKPSLVNIRAMLLITLCQHPASFDFDWMDQSWIDIAPIVRIAQTMGMHRDPQWFALDEYEREERRRVWYLLQYFDVYQTLLQGLPMLIRTGTMDVEFPAHTNLDDVAKRCQYFDSQVSSNISQRDSANNNNNNNTANKQSSSNTSNHSSPGSSAINNGYPPIHSEPLSVHTEMSFFLARSGMAMLSAQIYNITTSLETPNLPYGQLLALDSKIRLMFNRAHQYLTKSVLDEDISDNNNNDDDEDISEEAEENANKGTGASGLNKYDNDVVLLERFLYEIDYLKAVMVLHRKYSARGLDNIKYRRSREETVYSAEQMLKLQEWFYRSQASAKIRTRFSYIVTKLISPHFIHSTILLALYSIGNFDSYPLHAARAHLKRIETSCNISMDIGQKTGDIYVAKHVHFLIVLLQEAKSVFNMTPEQREELKQERLRRKMSQPNHISTSSVDRVCPIAGSTLNATGGPSSGLGFIDSEYSSAYNTFFYTSWESDRVRNLSRKFSADPDQFYKEWRLENFMDVDDDLTSALGYNNNNNNNNIIVDDNNNTNGFSGTGNSSNSTIGE